MNPDQWKHTKEDSKRKAAQCVLGYVPAITLMMLDITISFQSFHHSHSRGHYDSKPNNGTGNIPKKIDHTKFAKNSRNLDIYQEHLPRGREKLGLFRVLPKTPFSSQMLKVLSQLHHHHHHHLFLSHPCNPSQTFHDSFISTSQPSCSCMIPPWVLILFSIPLSSMLALFHSHCLTET